MNLRSSSSRLAPWLAMALLSGCTSVEDVSAEVVSMDADGVRIAVHAFPGATVGVQGNENVTADESGNAEVLVPLHPDAEAGHLVLTAHARGLLLRRAGMVDVALPRTAEEAERLGGHGIRLVLAETTDSPSPDRIEVVETATRSAATRRWTYARVAPDGWLELPLEGTPGTQVSCAGRTAALDAAGRATLRLWGPDLVASLADEGVLRDTITATLDATSEGREPVHVEIELSVGAAHLLRLAGPYLSTERPLFSTAPPAPATPPQVAVVLPGAHADELAMRRGRLAAIDRIAIATDLPGEPVERCRYSGGAGDVSFPHLVTGLEVVTRDARSGAEIGRVTVPPPPPTPCPESLAPDVHEIHERPAAAAVLAAIGGA